MCFKIDWASLIVGSKFTVLAFFYFVFEGNFQVQAPQGAHIRRVDATEGFLRHEFVGLIFGGANTRRGLFSEFYGNLAGTERHRNCRTAKKELSFFAAFTSRTHSTDQ